jgi:hypothetical protein
MTASATYEPTQLAAVPALTEEEFEDQVIILARNLGIPPALLTVDRPDGWPLTAAFPF